MSGITRRSKLKLDSRTFAEKSVSKSSLLRNPLLIEFVVQSRTKSYGHLRRVNATVYTNRETSTVSYSLLYKK